LPFREDVFGLISISRLKGFNWCRVSKEVGRKTINQIIKKGFNWCRVSKEVGRKTINQIIQKGCS
jgi:hypothetical protein